MIQISATLESMLKDGLIQLEIKGLAEPKSPEAERICTRGLERVDNRVRSGQTNDRARTV